MQSYSSTPGRSPMKAGAIDSKISAPAGKTGAGLGLGNGVGVHERIDDSPTKPGGKGSVKGFAGGVIDPKVKC